MRSLDDRRMDDSPKCWIRFESVQQIVEMADTFPFYLGSMLLFFCFKVDQSQWFCMNFQPSGRKLLRNQCLLHSMQWLAPVRFCCNSEQKWKTHVFMEGLCHWKSHEKSRFLWRYGCAKFFPRLVERHIPTPKDSKYQSVDCNLPMSFLHLHGMVWSSCYWNATGVMSLRTWFVTLLGWVSLFRVFVFGREAPPVGYTWWFLRGESKEALDSRDRLAKHPEDRPLIESFPHEVHQENQKTHAFLRFFGVSTYWLLGLLVMAKVWRSIIHRRSSSVRRDTWQPRFFTRLDIGWWNFVFY